MQMNTADVLVEMLKAYGVTHIFGVPGDTSMPFYDALYHARDEIAHIMVRDERSAASWPMHTHAFPAVRGLRKRPAVVARRT